MGKQWCKLPNDRTIFFWEKLQFLKITFWLTRPLLIEKLRPPGHMVKNSRDYFQLLNIHGFNYFNKNHKFYTTDAAEDGEMCCANVTAISSELKDLSSFYSHFFENNSLSQKFFTSRKFSNYSILCTYFSEEKIKCLYNTKKNRNTIIISNFKENKNANTNITKLSKKKKKSTLRYNVR